jgi:multiple sugar transport system permease protein
MFDVPKVYLDGGPANATTTTSVFIYGQAFTNTYAYNRASAASLIMFFIIAVLSIGLFFLMRDKEAAVAAKAARRARRAARGGGLL